MIVLRIAEGAIAHANARFSEWVGGVALAVFGYFLWVQPGIFGLSPSFRVMQSWADQGAWANIILTAGVIRGITLLLNGTLSWFRPYSPTLRFIASWIAFMVWSSIALGFFYAWRDTGGSPTGWVIYGLFVAPHELRNIYLTRQDMIAVRKESHALARKQ